MKIALDSCPSRVMALRLGVCIANVMAVGGDKPHWVVANDDVPPRLATISNNQSGTITAANWSYLALMAFDQTTGTGGVIYIAEYGGPYSIGEVNVRSEGGKCKLTECSRSPALDANSPGRLSERPPRPF
jgi:hypothetical protein